MLKMQIAMRLFAAALLITLQGARIALGGEPVAGVDVGLTLPIGDYRQLVEPGAALAPFAGYRWGDTVAIAFLVQPQFATFWSDKDVRKRDDNLTSIFSLTAGPRLSVGNEHTEFFLSAQGGIYTPTTGPFNKSAEGFNIAGGASLKLTDDITLGAYIRRDEPSIKVPGGDNVEFLVTGVDFQYRFLPAPPPAPEPPPAAIAAPAPAPVVKQKIVLRGVNFDTNKANIRPDAQPILDAAAKTLSDNTAVQIRVEGHTDCRNTDDYNQKLSERRASAVAEYLVGKGVDKGRLTAIGFGESKPVASNDSAEGMAQNRRVELRVTAGE